MKNRNKIAVVMINYNSWNHTVNCLRSIQSCCPLGNYKIFLIDNASTDQSIAQLKPFLAKECTLDIDLITSASNRGFSGGNNLGINKALRQGFGYVMLLNNDTIVQSDLFADTIKAFEEMPFCSIIAAHTVIPGGARELYCTRRKPTFGNLLFLHHTPFWNKKWFPGYKRFYMLDGDHRQSFPVYSGSGACLAFRSEYFETTGLMDEHTFLFGEEFILAEKALKAGLTTCFVPNLQVLHLGGQSTKQSSAFSFIEYCKSERYLIREYYNYGMIKCYIVAVMRLLKYAYKSISHQDYRKNIRKFIAAIR